MSDIHCIAITSDSDTDGEKLENALNESMQGYSEREMELSQQLIFARMQLSQTKDEIESIKKEIYGPMLRDISQLKLLLNVWHRDGAPLILSNFLQWISYANSDISQLSRRMESLSTVANRINDIQRRKSVEYQCKCFELDQLRIANREILQMANANTTMITNGNDSVSASMSASLSPSKTSDISIVDNNNDSLLNMSLDSVNDSESVLKELSQYKSENKKLKLKISKFELCQSQRDSEMNTLQSTLIQYQSDAKENMQRYEMAKKECKNMCDLANNLQSQLRVANAKIQSLENGISSHDASKQNRRMSLGGIKPPRASLSKVTPSDF